MSVLALHTTARRYCYDHFLGLDPAFREHFQYAILLHQYDPSFPWPEREAAILGSSSSILATLCRRIESVDPDNFADVDELYGFLMEAAGDTAGEEIPEPGGDQRDDDEGSREMLRYLDGFRRYLEVQMHAAWPSIAPLPYRRHVTPQEARRTWARLKRVWGAGPDEYWYPMLPPGVFTERPDVAAFDQLVFYWHVGWKGLRSILESLGAERIYQLIRGNEGDQCEIDVEFLELPVVGSDEMYWTSKSAEWLLYLSHEGTVTVAGERLLHAIQTVWPGWESGLAHEQTGKWPEELTQRLNF